MTNRQQGLGLLSSALVFAACVDMPPRIADRPAIAVETPVNALRTTTDLARGMRWELHWGSVSAYDVASGQHLRTVALPGAILSGAAGSCRPEMILDRTGALLVSSNITTRLWRISPARFETEVFDIEPDSETGKDFGFVALAWNASLRELYAASSPAGSFWRIDLTSGKAHSIPRPSAERAVAQGIDSGRSCPAA